MDNRKTLSTQAWWLPLYLAAAIPLGVLWARYGYEKSHLDLQGIDIVHHALMVHEVAREEGPNSEVLGYLSQYPQLSHRLAALLLPWCQDDPVLAVRTSIWIAAVWTFGFQLALLGRAFPWPVACLLLLGVQMGCFTLKVGTLNHFLWEGQFNYSRLVSAVGFWATLYLLSCRPAWPGGILASWAGALACAAFAFLCHLAPGLPALAAVGVYGLALAWEQRRPGYLGLALASVVVLVGLLVGSQAWQLMANNPHSDGWLPVRSVGLLALWPLAAAGVLWRIYRSRPSSPATPCDLAFGAGLGGAGALQTLLFAKYTLGSAAPYVLKSLSFLTFPLALLLGCCWVGQWVRSRSLQPASLNFRQAAAVWLGVVALLAIHLGKAWTRDPGRNTNLAWRDPANPRAFLKGPSQPAYLPVPIARFMAQRGRKEGVVYVDPSQPLGSIYINRVGMQTPERLGSHPVFINPEKISYRELFQEKGVEAILMPKAHDPIPYLGNDILVQEDGPFVVCRLRSDNVFPVSFPGSHESKAQGKP